MIMVEAGNNGGDALFAGVRLALRGVRVTAIRCLGTPHAAGLAALLAAVVGWWISMIMIRPWYRLACHRRILGIGGRLGLPDPVPASVIREARGIPTIAVDLPRGLTPTLAPLLRAAVQTTSRSRSASGNPATCCNRR